mgnify:CR=1 FL=1
MNNTSILNFRKFALSTPESRNLNFQELKIL